MLKDVCFTYNHRVHLLKSITTTTASFSSTPIISSYGLNNSINPFIYNNNPRNLERLRIAFKPDGFALDKKPSNFWNRLVIKQTNRHSMAVIEHHSGKEVVTASTMEWAIKKQLRSTIDVAAMEAIGRVLAQRCLECGLIEVHSEYEIEHVSSKILRLLKSLEEGGIALREPERFYPHRHWSREVKENPTQVYEDSQ